MLFLAIALTALAAFITFKKFGFASPLFFYSITNLSCVLCYLVIIFTDDLSVVSLRTALPLRAVGMHSDRVSSLYAAMAMLIIVSSFISIKGAVQGCRYPDIRSSIISKLSLPAWPFGLLGLLLLAMAAVHFVDIDKSILWKATGYLASLDSDEARIDTLIGALFQASQRLIGLFAASVSIVALHARQRILALEYAVLLVYILILTIARASRFTPALVGLSLVIDFYLCNFKLRPRHAFIFFVVIATYFLAMQQRSLPIQGLSQVPKAFSEALLIDFGKNFIALWVNSSQGAALYDSAMRFTPEYALKYKILSFSPLPSFIDGFSKIRGANEVRITHANPFNAYAEAMHFGLPYLMLLLCITVFIGAMISRALKRPNGQFVLPAAMLYYIAILVIGQYQLRTGVKFLAATYILSIVGTWIQARRRQPKQQSQLSSREGKLARAHWNGALR